jgi:RNA polymerase sigma-70 factor (ECF subfamily)
LFTQKYINDEDLSKDIVQETFLKLWDKQKDFHSSGSIKSFLYVTSRNASLNFLRDRKKEIFVEKGNEDLFADDFFLERLIEEETNRHLYAMVDSLPKRTKEVLWMSLNGLKQKEISEELDITIETVKSHKKLAYKILRKGVMIALVVFS